MEFTGMDGKYGKPEGSSIIAGLADFSGQQPTYAFLSEYFSHGRGRITTSSNELVAEIHDRMPVTLSPADYT